MKNIILILCAVTTLTACNDKTILPVTNCTREPNQEIRRQTFLSCVKMVSGARKGRDYTANDDEDFDQVIIACENSAYYSSLEKICDEPTPPQVVQ